MPGSRTSGFSEAEDYEAALRGEGCLGLLVTGPGQFRARLTQIALHHLRLSAGAEQLPRIALVAVLADIILVTLPKGGAHAPIWGGIRPEQREIMTLGAGQRLHMRTEALSRWGLIRLPAVELARYGSVLTGAAFAVASGAQWWQPRPAMWRHLRHLHSAAIGFVEGRTRLLLAAHGLEQQLIHALVECFSGGSEIETTPPTLRRQDIVVRFEALLQAQPERSFRLTEICAALGVTARTLRLSCDEQLGMTPTEYARRRRMQLAYRALRHGNPNPGTVSAVARRYGFRDLGRFAGTYRALYGELPSATLRRGLAGVTALVRPRPHVKFW
jgi:AraC-like DNA-binding protein